MEVIGNINHDTYICKVHHTELEKFLNQYFNGLNKLKTGDVVNLGDGYDFARDTQEALKTVSSLIKANEKVINTIMRGFCVLGNTTQEEATP